MYPHRNTHTPDLHTPGRASFPAAPSWPSAGQRSSLRHTRRHHPNRPGPDSPTAAARTCRRSQNRPMHVNDSWKTTGIFTCSLPRNYYQYKNRSSMPQNVAYTRVSNRIWQTPSDTESCGGQVHDTACWYRAHRYKYLIAQTDCLLWLATRHQQWRLLWQSLDNATNNRLHVTLYREARLGITIKSLHSSHKTHNCGKP